MTLKVVPLTVQTVSVVETKLTVSPELAVAMRENGTIPNVTLGSALKVIVCGWLES